MFFLKTSAQTPPAIFPFACGVFFVPIFKGVGVIRLAKSAARPTDILWHP